MKKRHMAGQGDGGPDRHRVQAEASKGEQPVCKGMAAGGQCVRAETVRQNQENFTIHDFSFLPGVREPSVLRRQKFRL